MKLLEYYNELRQEIIKLLKRDDIESAVNQFYSGMERIYTIDILVKLDKGLLEKEVAKISVITLADGKRVMTAFSANLIDWKTYNKNKSKIVASFVEYLYELEKKMDFLDVEIPGHVYDDISRWQVADKNFEVVNQDSEGKRSKEKEYNDEIKWLNKNLGLETADTLLLPQGIKEVFESRFSTFLRIRTKEFKVINKNTKVVAQSLIKYFITLKEFSQKLDAFHNSENIN